MGVCWTVSFVSLTVGVDPKFSLQSSDGKGQSGWRCQPVGSYKEKGMSLVSKLGERSEFSHLDIRNASRLKAVLEGVDLVVHAAGPFQRDDKCTVLQAAISTKTGYTDICDDYSWRAKSFHEQAKASGVPALITAGISPGVSNVMAAELVRTAESENDGEPETLRFFYYIAGTGGAGPTTLGSSLLLLGEDVIAYDKGREIKLKPYSGARNIDFGKGIGKKYVYLMNLPEVKSSHKNLGLPTVCARFGSDPFIWNWGMETFANFLPSDLLRDKNVILKFAEFVDPFVRVIDGIVGERVAMRPEGIAIDARKLLLRRASRGVTNFTMNKNPRMIE